MVNSQLLRIGMEGIMDRVRETASKVVDACKENPLAVAAAVTAVGGLAYVTGVVGPSAQPSSYQQTFMESRKTETQSGEAVVVRRLPNDRDAIRSAATMLSSGLAGDPMTITCAKQGLAGEKLRASIQWLYEKVLASVTPVDAGAIPIQAVDNENHPKALAVWYPPGSSFSQYRFLTSGGFAYVWRFSGLDRRMRYLGYGDQVQARRQRIMRAHPDHYYLMVLSSDEGPGADQYATTVLQPVLAAADAKGLRCVAEATSEGTANLLGRHGFNVVEEFALFGVAVKIMVRDG